MVSESKKLLNGCRMCDIGCEDDKGEEWCSDVAHTKSKVKKAGVEWRA